MSSPVIPREKLSAYQRWEMHSFDSSEAADRRQGIDREEDEKHDRADELAHAERHVKWLP